MTTWLSRWPWTIVATVAVLLGALVTMFTGGGMVHRANVFLLRQLADHEIELDIAAMIVVVIAGVVLDLLVERQRLRTVAHVSAHRLATLKATMTTVHDIVNNSLNNLQLVRFEAEGRLSESLLAVFDQVIHDTARELKALGDVEEVLDQPMAIGTGIRYSRSQSHE